MDRTLLEFWQEAPDDPLAVLFELAPVFALSTDAEGRLLRVSRPWAEAMGYPRDEMTGRDAADFVTERSRRHVERHVLPAFRRTGVCRDVELEFVRSDGALLPVLLSATSVLAPDGAFRHSLAFLTDMRNTRSALAALERKAEEAEEASQAKSRFLAAMSHEIRTPMNAILGFAQLLELSNLDDMHRGHVRAIISAGNSLMTLLRDLLDHSQVEAGYMRIEPRAFDLFALLEEVADFWQGPARDRGLRFDVTVDRGLPRQIVSDPVRLRQVLNNYLGNAVKFTLAGRIELKVERHPDGRAAPGADDGHTVIRFRVTDTGPGIAPADVDRLFTPFVQVGAETEVRPGGWGLGLSICQNIATALGARVGVETTPGRGASFLFDLPAPGAAPEVQSVALAAPEAHPEPPPEGPPLRVLLAEDNGLNQDMMRTLLQDMGHEVETVANGFEAVEAVARRRFDLVVMDIMMPGLDGAAAAERIRASDTPGRDVPIIACSAHVSPDAQDRFRALGIGGFLPKPVDRGALLRLMAAVPPRGTTDGPP